MNSKKFSFNTKVWLWPGFAGWHFVYVDKKISDFIYKKVKENKLKTSPNGLIPIKAKIGKTEWVTSLFPHKKENIYLMAIKNKVRKAEAVFDGDNIKISFCFFHKS